MQVNVFGEPGAAARPSVRPAYLAQVRCIAPPVLIAREAELAELAAFCAEPGREPYAWWQAEAWAGKSAVLSAFVRCPPERLAGRVEIVSFFVTSRLACRETREDFSEVLLEQLAELTGQDLPAALPQEVREAWLPDLLAQAARTCQDDGRRLVLVVDGLDEDQSVTTGPRARSIAGLLPAEPPAGMRVIVTGRPGPPVPDDVPDWHPLRDPAVIRPLSPSPHAGDTRRLARQEIQGLLAGTAAGRDVLGLLTAACGGLSAADLHELTGAALWEIEAILHGAAGRAFSRRPGRAPGGSPEVYLLGHEELQAAAARYLTGRLTGYQGLLHEWAGRYRDRDWPAGTPEYLLSGYFRLLATLGDSPRVIAAAADTARHDRMLDLTGSDIAALAEARAALDLIAAQDVPDLDAALAIAFHRDHLTGRNMSIPVRLPAVWVALGQPGRAEALVATLTSPYRAGEAMARVAGALAEAGQYQQAQETARSVTFPGWQADAMSRVARALIAAGQYQQAETAARCVDEPGWRAETLARVAATLAGAGQHRQAKAIADSMYKPDWQVEALSRVAAATAAAGQDEQARIIADEALAAARSLTGHVRPGALAGAAEALAAAGQHEQAEAIAEESLAAASAMPDLRQKAAVLTRAATALARARRHQQAAAVASRTGWSSLAPILTALTDTGQHQEAQSLVTQALTAVHSSPDTAVREYDLTRIARALARAGQYQQAEEIARSIVHRRHQADVLTEVAGALARAGQHQRAEEVARSISEPEGKADALTRVARALGRAGKQEPAEVIAGQAQALARSTALTHWRDQDLATIAAALTAAARHRDAEAVAGSITEPQERAEALALTAGAYARAHHRRRASAAARQALETACSVADPYQQAEALAAVAQALAAGRRPREAAAAARLIAEPYRRTEALAQMAGAHATAGQHRRARTVARSITAPEQQGEALARISEALTAAGRHKRAAAAARSIAVGPAGLATTAPLVAGVLAQAGLQQRAEVVIDSILVPGVQAEGLARIAAALAGRGLQQEAERAALQAVTIAQSVIGSRFCDLDALVTVAGTLAQAGQHHPAETLARSIPDPDKQAVALAAVAGALAQAGQHRRAEALGRSITDPDRQAEALAAVAGALARAGQHRQAEALGRSITVPNWQAEALAVLAEKLAEAGDPRSARQAAAAACAAGYWTTGTRSVLLLEPGAFAA